jgi:MinD superfamily P-loop ATPase
MYIATASGKGGTGKTLVSTALALSAGKCTYVDLDVEEPNGFIFLDPKIEKEIPYSLPVPVFNENVCVFCEACSKACSYNALAVIPPLRKVMFFTELCHSCGVCSYVCPVEGAITETDKEIGKIRIGGAGDVRCIEGRLNVGLPSGVPLISGIIREHIDKKDLLIIDAPPGTSCPVVESIKDSDYVILVTEPTPFGLNDLKLAAEIVVTLKKNAGIIINKDTGKNAGIEDFAKQANIPILARIPYTVEIQEAYSRGIPLTESMPGIKEEFTALLETITGEK